MARAINVRALQKLMEERGLSIRQFAKMLSVDHSYLYRVLVGDKPGGGKVLIGILRLCNAEGLDVADYIFLDDPLSTENGKAGEKEVSA